MSILLTDNEKMILRDLVEDARDWEGVPLWNADKSLGKEAAGVLTSLKKKKILLTMQDEASDGRRKNKIEWVSFTKTGLDVIKENFPELERSIEIISEKLEA